MNKYLITLTPVDRFFFGGEIGFSRGSKIEKKENETAEEKTLRQENEKLLKVDETNSSYIVKSKLFPQQTSLLGMLRFAFLSANDKAFANGKIIDHVEATKTIGAESFSLGADTEMNFGKIKTIYPCFLRRKTAKQDWINLTVAPMDYKLSITFDKGNALLNNRKMKTPAIKGYDPKAGLTSYCIGENISELETGKLFTEDIRIGIDRNFDGKPNEGAFYKQIAYRMSEEYEYEQDGVTTTEEHQLCFAFHAVLEEGLDDQIVTLGGDNSRFKLTCVLDEGCVQLPKNCQPDEFNGYAGKVVLLSDAFIDHATMNGCLYSINEIVTFRFLYSKVGETTGYYKFSCGNHLRRSEKKYNLYQTGSVFYFDTIMEMETFIVALESKKRFRQIGYNYYEKFQKQNNNNN